MMWYVWVEVVIWAIIAVGLIGIAIYVIWPPREFIEPSTDEAKRITREAVELILNDDGGGFNV